MNAKKQYMSPATEVVDMEVHLMIGVSTGEPNNDAPGWSDNEIGDDVDPD